MAEPKRLGNVYNEGGDPELQVGGANLPAITDSQVCAGGRREPAGGSCEAQAQQ